MEIEVSGFKINRDATSEQELRFEELCYSLADKSNRVKREPENLKFNKRKDGLILLLVSSYN